MNGNGKHIIGRVINHTAAVLVTSRLRTKLTVGETLAEMRKHLNDPFFSLDRYNYLFGRGYVRPNTYYEPAVLLAVTKAAKLTATEAFALFDGARAQASEFQKLRSLFTHDEYLRAWEPYVGVTLTVRFAGEFVPPPVPYTVIGRQEDVANIQQRLMPTELKKRSRIIVIRGLPGVGKSDFMNKLLNESEGALKKAFPDGILWVEMRKETSSKEMLGLLGRQLGLGQKLAGIENIEEAANYVRQALRGLNVLVVVDGLWRLQDGITIKRIIPSSGVALFTTRFTGIAHEVAESSADIYKLAPLHPADFRNLMRYLMPSTAASLGSAFDELADTLGGLPLAARVAAARLERDFAYGFNIRDSVEDLLRRFSAYTAAKVGHAYADASDAPDLHRQFHLSLSVMPLHEQEAFARIGAIASRQGVFSLDAMETDAMLDTPQDSLRALIAAGLVEPLGAGRFQMHTMLAMYARYLHDGGGVDELVYEGIHPL